MRYFLECVVVNDSLNDGNLCVCVCLNQGGKSREKVVKILGSMTPDEILEKLKKEASS